jgi:hypothetical protein
MQHPYTTDRLKFPIEIITLFSFPVQLFGSSGRYCLSGWPDVPPTRRSGWCAMLNDTFWFAGGVMQMRSKPTLGWPKSNY